MTAESCSPLRLHHRPGLPAMPSATPPAGSPGYTQGTLALHFDLPTGIAAVPQPPTLTVLPGGRSGRFGSTAGGLPDVRDWAARFCQAIVEVLGGDRPVTQLVRWTSGPVYADLAKRVRILGRTTDAVSRGQVRRPQLRSVHVCQLHSDVAEVAVHVRYGPRSRAVAARLEVVNRRWLCTALQLG